MLPETGRERLDIKNASPCAQQLPISFWSTGRIYYFENACQLEVQLGSADWLPRNLFRRIEVVFPIEDGNLRERIINEVRASLMADKDAREYFLERRHV